MSTTHHAGHAISTEARPLPSSPNTTAIIGDTMHALHAGVWHPVAPRSKAQSIERFKGEKARAERKGLQILPSVDGPYAFDPVSGRVLGREGSAGYADAVSHAGVLHPVKGPTETHANSTFRIVHKQTGQFWSSAYGWVWPGTKDEREATLYDAQDAAGPLPEQVRDVGEWQIKTDD